MNSGVSLTYDEAERTATARTTASGTTTRAAAARTAARAAAGWTAGRTAAASSRA